jgi:hypothetical protein
MVGGTSGSASMPGHWLLRFAAVLCPLFFFGNAIAEPVVYSFSGYFATRDTVTQKLPAWALGPPGFSGTLTFDLDHSTIDPESGLPVITPLEAFYISDQAGRALYMPWSGGRLFTASTPTEGERVAFGSLKAVGTGDARYLVEAFLEWTAPGQGQVPQDPGTLDIAALDPNSWRVTIVARPPVCDVGCVSHDVVTAQLSSLTRLPSWEGNVSRFNSGAPGWQPQSGTWVAGDGVYRNTSNQSAAISLLDAEPGSDYRIDVRMSLQWSADGNRGGLVYDYVDARNYRAVLISPNNATHPGGVLEVIEVVGGARRVVARATGSEPPYRVSPDFFAGQFGRVSVARNDGATCVIAGSVRITIPQAEVEGGSVGIIGSWNLVRFDDFVLGALHAQE